MSTAVCFDLDGTVIEFTVPYETILDRTFDAALDRSIRGAIETYNEAFYEALSTLEPEPYLAGMRAVCDQTDTDADPTSLVEILREREFAATAVSEETRSLLDSLGQRHRLGIVTNGVPEWQEAKLRQHGLRDRFDTVICSSSVGAHTPDPAPFAAAKARLDADTHVMIGDNYEADIEGARNASFVPVHLSDASEIQIPDLDSLGTLLNALR
jgi:putative hydrolase of the HAD superfamily